MATELRPGTLAAILRRLGDQADRKARRAVEDGLAAIVTAAKANASTGSHSKRTHTPAVKGVTGPARISGTLAASITHSPVSRIGRGATGRVYVGPAAAVYGDYLERHGYAFLAPAAQKVRTTVLPLLSRRDLGGSWR